MLVCQFDAQGVMTHIRVMRRVLRFLPFLLILPAGAIPVAGSLNPQPNTTSLPQEARGQDTTARDLDALFVRLRYSETAEAASKIEADIFIRLTTSPSPSINLLMETANVALAEQNNVAAKAILMDVARLDPKFAEGLTRAALLSYQDGDYYTAQNLLKRAVALESRHFGAWAGLGLVREELGDLKGAQQAYREAIYLHPFLDSAKRGLVRLEAKTDGLSL